ncbi:hypothetical protein MASR2M78_08540 [Treponema sp.]
MLANVASGAPLTIQPLSAGTTVSIGAAGGTFALDDAELVLLQDGFTAITLGRANSGAVTIDTANFRDPITILGGGVITVAAGTPSLATTQDNAPITITSSVLAGIIASGGISSNGSGFIDINSGAAFTEANGVAIASGSGNITIDTTDTNDQSINGTLVTGGIGTILLTASHSIIMDTDSAITSDTGTIILDADAVAAGSLVLDVVQSTGGAQITLRAGTGGTITEADNTALVSTSGLLFINDAAAGLSVGGAGNAALNTDVGTLRAQTSGNLYINEANAINLGNVGGGITSSGGLIDISAGGAITIAANVSASTGMTITSSANIDRTGGTSSSGGTMFLSAGTYIGVDTLSDGAADPTWIATSAANLRATAANGGMYINETNAIVLGDGIGGLTATNGDILVVAGGVITTANTISAAGAGSDIALTGTSITISNSLGATVTETFTGPTTVAAGATITGGSGLMLFNSAVTHNGGTITAGNLAAGTSAIRFVSTYTGTGGTLSGNNNVLYNPDIEFRGDVVFGTFTHNSDRIVFSGGAAQDFDTNLAAAPTNFLSDVLVNKTAGTLSLITNNVLQNGSSLRLQSGNLDLRANGRSWLMDSALGAIPAVAFTGRDGTLRLDAGTILQCNNFTSEAGHTIDNQGANTVDTQGDVSILGSFITPNNSTLVMHGPGFTLTAIPTTLGTQIGNLRISGLSSIELSPAIATSISLGADLYLYGNMIIDTSGSLDVTATPYNITVDGNWNNLIDDTAGPFTGFNARTGTVTFTNSSTTISGNNAWYVFAATLPGGTILFENSKRQTILTGGSFIAKGAAGNRLTLSRITGLQNVDLIWNPIFAPPNPSLMWQIDFLPGSSVITSEHLLIKYSDARSHPVVTPPDTELYNSEALPLPTDPFTAKTCYRWIDSIQAVNSYTEDSNGNGKIDRIRVTAEASLTYNFTGFDALVEDYEIDRTRGTNGFEPKLDAGPTPAYLGTEFFINLKEKPYVDTGNTPRWRFLFNTTLRDTSTDTKNLDTIETWMVPADNALPRVAYTLSYPGSNQVFIQFSEPVYAIGATVLSAGDLGSSSLDRLTVSGTATSEALATYLAPFDAVTLASGTTDITLVATINDGAVPATNYSIDPYWTASGIVFPEPYYAYPVVTQPILDPNFIAATAHRATDVLISIPPSSAAADTYFVWPIWAKDSVSTAIAQSQYENLTPDEAASQTIGLIRDFTGDYWLRDQDFTLEARINPVLPATTALRLHLDTNVDASKSATSINGPAGLWLPIFAETAFSGIVPKPNEDTTAVLASSVGSNLWDFAVDADNPKIKSISTLDFFFTLGNENVLNPLYAGRLEMSPGAAIPANWYRLVKPFTFQIHDVKKQRGSVTILNNVIDPTKGERVRISYQLTKSGQTVIQVFTLDGDLIDVLYRGNRAAGDYTAIWDGRNRAGKAVARGMYFVRVVGPEIDEIRKVLVVK